LSTGVISADGHIDTYWIPDNIFVAAVPQSMQDRVPRLEDRPEGRVWVLNGEHLMANRVMGQKPGDGPDWDRMAATGIYADAAQGRLRPSTPDLRLKDQELDGIDAEVIYGILGLDRQLQYDEEALRACYRIYYEWVADFARTAPNRFAPIVPLACASAAHAVEDMHYVASLGLKGVEIRPGGNGKPFWHRSWEPLWSAAEETGLPVHFHSDIGKLSMSGTPDERREFGDMTIKAMTEALSKMANAEHLVAMIFSGALDRHPGLTLVLGEADVSWIPHVLARMDFTLGEREYDAGLELKPSEYWYRQCRATFQSDQLGMELVAHLGAENIMWGNDYPHPDGVWPQSQRVIATQMAGLAAADRQKIVHDNAAKLYGFE
jgi:uncharacterized protein